MASALTTVDSAFEHGYAQVGGVRLHYAQCGNGEQLVILLHGFPQNWYAWRYQLRALGEKYKAVAPDMRGYGLSDKPIYVKDYEIRHLVDDVTGLIRHFGAREATIIGHDWGAGVGWAVAQAHPEYVRKLAALQVPPPAAWNENLTFRQALRSWYMLFFQIPRLPELWISLRNFYALERMFRTTTVRAGVFSDTDIAIYKEALRERGALTAAINYYRANFLRMFVRRAGATASRRRRITVPTLFIYGEHDVAIVPETVRDVGRFIDAPFRELRFSNCGHWVQEEEPEAVNEALLSFLSQ